MKFAAVLCLIICFSQVAALKITKNPAEDIALVVEGLLTGIFEGEFPVKDCFDDSEQIIEDFEKAYIALKKGMNVVDIGEALVFVGDGVKKIPAAIKECESCTGIIKEIEGLAELFSNPVAFLESIGMNIIWHYKDITGDLHKAKEDWEAKKYQEFGEFIGKIVAIAMKHKSTAPTTHVIPTPLDAALFFKGFMETASGPVGDLTKCVDTSEALTYTINDLLEQF
jgi:hypothetical protein